MLAERGGGIPDGDQPRFRMINFRDRDRGQPANAFTGQAVAIGSSGIASQRPRTNKIRLLPHTGPRLANINQQERQRIAEQALQQNQASLEQLEPDQQYVILPQNVMRAWALQTLPPETIRDIYRKLATANSNQRIDEIYRQLMDITNDNYQASAGVLQYALDNTPQLNNYFGIDMPVINNNTKRLITQLVTGKRQISVLPARTALIPQTGQMYRKSIDLAQRRRNMTTNYNFKDTALLQAYPQWALKHSKQLQNQKKKQDDNIAFMQDISNRNSERWTMLNTLSPALAQWNEEKGQWRGQHAVQIQRTLVTRQKNKSQKIAQNQRMLQTKTSQSQIDKAIPPIIAQIVNANDALSSVGFGPIKDGGTPLYAGRWLDTQTGNIRVLPTANSKYINPLERQQQLAYLQGKMLNHWNNIVSTSEQYKKVKQTGPQQYRIKRANQIKKALDMKSTLIQSANYINNKIVGYFMIQQKDKPNTWAFKLLDSINPQDLQTIYEMGPGKIQDDQSTRQNSQILQILTTKELNWQGVLKQSFDKLVAQIGNANLTNVQMTQQQADLGRAYLNMTSLISRRLKGALIKAQKAITIPNNLTGRQLVTAAQSVDQGVNGVKQMINQIQGGGMSTQQFQRMADFGTRFQTGAIDKNQGDMQLAVNDAKGLLQQLKKVNYRVKADKGMSRAARRAQIVPGLMDSILERRVL